MRSLPLALRILYGVGSLPLALLVPLTLHGVWLEGEWWPLLPAVAAALINLIRIEILPVTRGERISFTLGSLAVFFLLVLLGPAWATLAAMLDSLVISVRARSSWYKVLYNISAGSGGMWAAAWVLGLAPGNASPLLRILTALLSATAFVAINHTMVLLAVAVSARQRLLPLWWSHYGWVTAQEWLLSVTGLSLGYALVSSGWYALLLASPLVLIVTTYHRYARTQKEHTRELEHFANQLITTLAAVVDARDAYTFGHSTQVARYSVALGRELGYTGQELERLRVGALLHDIGKVGIPESILYKPGKLDPWEYQLMKEHAAIGYRIVSSIDRLGYAADIIHQHHEWFNGQGYPRGLSGNEVLRDARIVGVADALESLLSDRPYRKGCTVPEALAEIRRWSGTQFDPQVVTALEHLSQREGPLFFVNSAALVDEMQSSILTPARSTYQAAVAAAPSAQ